MSSAALNHLPRTQRRKILEDERRARKTGNWGAWETLHFPRGTAGSGWASNFTTAHKNKVFCILDGTLPCGTRHLMITSLSGERPTWHEAQRIKDEIAGPDATAVEVYPPKDEIVDDADAYHLWVLTEPLSFSIYGGPRTRVDNFQNVGVPCRKSEADRDIGGDP